MWPTMPDTTIQTVTSLPCRSKIQPSIDGIGSREGMGFSDVAGWQT